MAGRGRVGPGGATRSPPMEEAISDEMEGQESLYWTPRRRAAMPANLHAHCAVATSETGSDKNVTEI